LLYLFISFEQFKFRKTKGRKYLGYKNIVTGFIFILFIYFLLFI